MRTLADLNELLDLTNWKEGGMAPTRELSIKTMERIIKLLWEENPTWYVAKSVGCSQSAVSKNLVQYKIERLWNVPFCEADLSIWEFKPAWWRIFFLFVILLASKNSSHHKIPRAIKYWGGWGGWWSYNFFFNIEGWYHFSWKNIPLFEIVAFGLMYIFKKARILRC